MEPIRVLIVEDSMTQRHQLQKLIQAAPDMTVIAQARDGLEALQLVEKLRPDVISMDLRMPNLDGIETTREIMDRFPTPIVIVSNSLSDSQMTMQAMQAGALTAIEKPPASDDPEFERHSTELVAVLRLMAGVPVMRRLVSRPLEPALPGTRTLPRTDPLPALVVPNQTDLPEIVVIGASAGGPSALAQVLSGFPSNFALPILMVQHLSREFMPGLAEWLDRAGPLPVRIPVQGETVLGGVVYLAPGGSHMRLSAKGRIMLDFEQGSYRHHPAVDVLLESAAAVYGARAVGVILTGMGDDGAFGLRAMHNARARTIVQNEATCVVFGMPAAAIAAGAAEFVLPLDKISSAVVKLCGGDNKNGTGSSTRRR